MAASKILGEDSASKARGGGNANNVVTPSPTVAVGGANANANANVNVAAESWPAGGRKGGGERGRGFGWGETIIKS